MLAILDHLNIGVYYADGSPLLPGSEDEEDDFWLLAELVYGLADSALRSGPTFGAFVGSLAGIESTDISAAAWPMPTRTCSRYLLNIR